MVLFVAVSCKVGAVSHHPVVATPERGIRRYLPSFARATSRSGASAVENGRVAYNRSAPPVSVTPVLTYPNVREAVDWLVRVFGFAERVRVGDHRAQLSFGDGALIVADDSGDRSAPGPDAGVTHSVMVRVTEIDKHYADVQAAGVSTLSEPTDMSYGERQYSVRDPAGHRWTFTESVMDMAPEQWGGEAIQPWT